VGVAPAETLAVSVTGTGPVIVLLSGPIGSAYTWRHVIPALAAAGYQIVTIDPLGMGRSGRPRHADYTLEAQAERVRATLDTLQVASAVFAAHGVSGSIAMRLALGHPSRVAALVSIEGGPAERAGSPSIKRRRLSHRCSSFGDGR
jgi:pimeloyl-ACP methyl ester carboxylesterase